MDTRAKKRKFLGRGTSPRTLPKSTSWPPLAAKIGLPLFTSEMLAGMQKWSYAVPLIIHQYFHGYWIMVYIVYKLISSWCTHYFLRPLETILPKISIYQYSASFITDTRSEVKLQIYFGHGWVKNESSENVAGESSNKNSRGTRNRRIQPRNSPSTSATDISRRGQASNYSLQLKENQNRRSAQVKLRIIFKKLSRILNLQIYRKFYVEFFRRSTWFVLFWIFHVWKYSVSSPHIAHGPHPHLIFRCPGCLAEP